MSLPAERIVSIMCVATLLSVAGAALITPAFGKKLSDEDIDGVVAYIRTFSSK